jgi:flagellar basal-body rod protein FlgG
MGADLFQILNISQQDMQQRVQDLDVVSNNLSNVNTPGFKQSRANFQELLSNLGKDGSHLSSTQVISTQGSLKTTQNPLDLAVSGEGFFSVTLPDGKVGYTRDGELHLDPNQRLVNSSGYPLVWQGQIPAGSTDVSVGTDGTVSARQGDAAWVAVGNIRLTRFANPTGLQDNGQNVLLATADSGAPLVGTAGVGGFGLISADSVEMANVNMADELTHMITLQRAFQLSTQAFQQTDQMISQAITMRRA